MKAISLCQPWADLIALGYKTVETRYWATKYRGPLLICAAKRHDRAVQEQIDMFRNPDVVLPDSTLPLLSAGAEPQPTKQLELF